MRSVRFQQPGKPEEVLQVENVEIPQPAAGEVQIKVLARPIHPADLMFIQNLYGIRPQFPSSGAGFEGVGTVEAVGDGVQLPLGSRVSFTAVGSWQEYVVTSAKAVLPVPEGVPDEVAAQLFINPFTAWAMIEESGVQPGQWLLVTAAGSAFSQIVIQLCKRRGIRVVGTVRRPDLIEELRQLGADEIINTETERLHKRIMEITGGKGVPCALEAVGGQTGADALQCLQHGGTLLTYGALGLDNIPVNPGIMIFKALTIKGFWLTEWMQRAGAEVRQRAYQDMAGLLTSGEVKLPIEATYPLEHIKEAVLHANRPGRTGKILLV